MRNQSAFLSNKKRYLQIAFNSSLDDAKSIISQLPVSDRILIEAGTPLIKRYGQDAIVSIKAWADSRFSGSDIEPYIVADLKTMDRGETEVEIASEGGAKAAIALGKAPVETLDAFVESCVRSGLDSMIDMMNVDFPLSVLRSLKKLPQVVMIHRGVDEEKFNREKQIPFHEIQRIKGNYDIMLSIAGADTSREVQRSVFNGADIVVVWKSVYQSTEETIDLINGFLKDIK
jgi:bifunctional enzyme Fae/Hps